MAPKQQLGGPFELLESATGRPTTDADIFSDRWTLLYFGFSKCAEVCPNTLRFLAELMDACDVAYGNTRVDGAAPFHIAKKEDEEAIREATAASPDTAAKQAKLQTVFVSVDYVRDAPPVLDAFLQRYRETQPDPARIRGLCGGKDAVEQAARVWRVYFSSMDETEEERLAREAKGVDAPKPIDDTFQFDHSSAIYLVGPDGKMKDFFFREMGLQNALDRVGVHYDDVYGFSDTRTKPDDEAPAAGGQVK
ncbi:cytochrome c oxidase assembly factor-like protein [Strigomonas culicis]|uniref:Cytochrome c oxidase assembly factor-like protein n=1 Tax=Strigomonas culicis TaxID=28005 RepID=S9VKA6_9TRYP|nr:cytochrome c oxidase assembly factor-like protein [Strigomonas culicis]|eukprot:EPY27531.1 cytochrome c oxidase assembly factor-like protein [Strigomonas culicis]